MYLEKFLESPNPRGGIKIPTNELITKYREKYEKIKRNIKSNVYTLDRKKFYVLVRIPSAEVKDFTYDVVIEFTSVGKSLEESHIKIFSNSPSFVYSFAYVFYHLEDEGNVGMIIDKFEKHIPKERLAADITDKKIGKEVLHGKPVHRNPFGIPLLDKTLYYAVFHILDKYTKITLIQNSRRVNEQFFINNVKSFEKTMLLREKMLQGQKKEKIRRIVRNPKVAQELERRIDQGNNVVVHNVKRTHDNKVRVTPSKNVTRVKAAKTSITKIKKMK